MSRPASASSSRFMPWIIGIVAAGLCFAFVPLFHVVPLKATRQQTADAAFNAADFVDTFWNGPLARATGQAVEATELLTALQTDPTGTAARLGHRLGLSGSTSYFVAGRGEITAVTADAIVIALPGGGTAIIEIGPVFGNAIRDGSGLLNVSDFANAQDFNAISSEINLRVETLVFPVLQARAAVGATVRFVGGVEISDADAASSPQLSVVPVVIEFS